MWREAELSVVLTHAVMSLERNVRPCGSGWIWSTQAKRGGAAAAINEWHINHNRGVKEAAAGRLHAAIAFARSPALSPSDDFATRAQSVSFNSSTLALNMSSAKIVQVTFWRLNLASYNNEIHFKATTCWQLSRAQNFLAPLSLCGGKGKELVDASQIIFSCVLCFFSLAHTRARRCIFSRRPFWISISRSLTPAVILLFHANKTRTPLAKSDRRQFLYHQRLSCARRRKIKSTLAAADWHIDGARCCWSSNWKHLLCGKSHRFSFLSVRLCYLASGYAACWTRLSRGLRSY